MLLPLTKLKPRAKVAVVGGGVSGLCFTYFLSKLRPDVEITLFESQNRTGGWIYSCNTRDMSGNPIMLEKGPRTLRGVSDGTVLIMDTLKDLGKEAVIQSIDKGCIADKKFLLDPSDKLVQVPNSISTTVKFLLNPLGKGLITGMMGEWFRKKSPHPGQDESVESICDRRFGNNYISNNMISALLRGIYGDDVSLLSAKRTFKKIYYNELKHGSNTQAMIDNMRGKSRSKKTENLHRYLTGCLNDYSNAFGKDRSKLLDLSNTLKKYPMLGLAGGLETFPKIVRNALNEFKNVKIVTGNPVTQIMKRPANETTIGLKVKSGDQYETFDHLRLTITPPKIAELLPKDQNSLSKLLDEIQSNTIILVNYYLPNKDVIDADLQGFGYLVPKSNKNPGKLLGVIFDSVIERNFKPLFDKLSTNPNAPNEYTKVTAMIGGCMLNEHGVPVVPSREVTISAVKDALNNHLGISNKDLEAGQWEFTIADRCLPRFHVGYDAWQERAERKLQESYGQTVSVGGMGFSRSPGVPDVIVDGFNDALQLSK
ncbi:BBT_HP_G0114910.mRNA.1.CDS.1 [Saccharomyces cerevisiae]|nr:BBT_HP_G0025310.mRNA.1.CDS.1 [Saccharomyces cerevisiae]CAI4946886.1 BTE_HP_G0018230.mRNA.1.CDS.1 [Saccharomyces cerevisiae]CAI5024212.1 BBT_HP_G0101480.mRNA.1.CDS.1 [Saccharomyces cerevisiae]CAI5044840.1 BBT_HP_G0114910.mRNA.1.CDS.1 [Saccharomyces cerevisiae]CAI5157021.1 BTE_HP_G0126940.mRNA.1.CDS.1 [Saccharomyces cerevisiae]